MNVCLVEYPIMEEGYKVWRRWRTWNLVWLMSRPIRNHLLGEFIDYKCEWDLPAA